MEFKEKMPLWENEGVEPPKSKRESGWTAGDKPPADWFNWLHNRTYKSLLELRENSIKIDQELKKLEAELENTSSEEEVQVIQKKIDELELLSKAQAEQIDNLSEVVVESGNSMTQSIQELERSKADKEDLSRSSTIVIANYDSHESSKKGADILINKGENAAKKINDAIQSLKGTGGEVKLMEGKYNLEYGIAVNVDNVHLTGIPNATILVQNTNWKENPYNDGRKHIIDTRSDNVNLKVSISNLTIQGAKISDSGGFYCWGNSQVTNCISENSGGNGFDCWSNSQVANCISVNSGGNGFYCWGNSQVANCISENSSSYGFGCGGSSQVTNCTSVNSGNVGFYCGGSSQVTNCTSVNSGSVGFRVTFPFEGICSFNTLKEDKLEDNSSSPAVVEYNVIQEVQ